MTITDLVWPGGQVGKGLGGLLYYLIRVSFLLSVITIFPMQMQPYRESFMKLFFGRILTGSTPGLRFHIFLYFFPF